MDAAIDWGVEPRIVALENHPGNSDLVYPLPGIALFAFKAITFRLVTSATAANRQAVIKLVDSTGAVLFAQAAPAVQAASLTVDYSFAPGVQPFGTAALGTMGGPFMGGRLPQNVAVVFHVAAGVAADVLSNVRLLVHQRLRDTNLDGA